MTIETTPSILLLLFAYCLGSVPFGLVLTRCFTSVDIRAAGSGNIGATNVRRTAGNLLGLLTLAADMLKGAVPVLVSLYWFPAEFADREIWISLIGLSAFLGHLYPVYSGFRNGGKGVATAAGCFLVISATACCTALAVFALVVAGTRRVSAGSMTAAAVLPPVTWWRTSSVPFVVLSLVVFSMILFRHRDNIRRLISGQEPPL